MRSGERTSEAVEAAAADHERRGDPRRRLPFGRSALLQVNGRDHVVALIDVSRGGAFVSTRAAIPRDASLCLKLWLPSSRGELLLPSQLVRVIPQGDGRPAGVALRFVGAGTEAARRLAQFVEASHHLGRRLHATRGTRH